jgi:DNA-binding MarR family transcriptional regulator
MPVQETSLFAYMTEIKPSLGDRQRLVLDEIRKHKHITNSELSRALHLPINSITGRCKELRDKGYVEEWGKRTCEVTKRVVIAWRAKY